ncbi:MAG: MTH938/NDUFAF3 family protein [Steroidobacteraceae bacterium]|nr:MTH938/NDUFAF3 family protein [Steroidobacteraceae bacterium]
MLRVMEIALDSSSARYVVRTYAAAELRFADQTVVRNDCIVAAQTLLTDWRAPEDLEALDTVSLAPALALQPTILLVGVGRKGALPILRGLRRELSQRRIALEVMELGAACRTYNVLAAEYRAVVAALVLR